MKHNVGVEFLIHDNYLAGFRIENSNYEFEEFDLNRIESRDIERTSIEFPPSDIDLFYEGLDAELKSKLDPDALDEVSLIDILNQIETKAFDKNKHLENRYRNSV